MELTDDDFLQAAQRVAGVVGERAPAVRIAEDAIHPVFRAGSVVVRIEVSEVPADVATRVANCRRMRDAGVPWVAPVIDEAIPVPGLEYLVATVWQYVEPVLPIDWAALGRALVLFHDYDGLTLPPQSVTERLAHAVNAHPTLDPSLADRFRAAVPPLEATFASVGWDELPLVPSHGDLWTKNVIPTRTGGVLFCDHDALGLRPAAFDLGLLYHESDGDHRWGQLVDAYGRDRVPSVELLRAGLQAGGANWISYVLEHRRDWVEYTEYLAKGAWAQSLGAA